MAKKITATINLSGISINDILGGVINPYKLNEPDLARLVGRLVSASNKRIRNLEKTAIGRLSPAYKSRKENYDDLFFSTKGKDRQALLTEFKEAKGFLSLKTSSVRGWNKLRTDIINKVQEKIDENTTGYKVDLKKLLTSKNKEIKFWKAYRKLEEAHGKFDKGGKGSKYGSDQIQALLSERVDKQSGFGGFRQTYDDILGGLQDKVTQLYEESRKDLPPVTPKRKSPSDVVNEEDEDDGTYEE